MPLVTQLGVKTETTWGTAVTVDKFFEHDPGSESIGPNRETIETASARAATRGMREDRFIPYVSSYAGAIKMPVLTKQWGFWPLHMLGASVSTGSLTDSTYTHTYTLAGTTTLCGKGFTAQVNRPIGLCGETDQAFTYAGGKIKDWTLSCEQGGVVEFEANCVFKAGTTGTGLATASYSTGMEFMPFGLATVVIGGAQVDVKSWSVKCDNGLKDDRKMIRGSYEIKEPIEGMRKITFEAVCDFESLTTVYNRVVSATAAGTLASVVISNSGPTLAGTTTFPGLVITMDKVRFDGDAPTGFDGAGIAEAKITGTAMVPVSGTWLSIAYRSTEATPV